MVVTDNVDDATRERLEREYPGARVVTREWVSRKRKGDATPVKPKKAPTIDDRDGHSCAPRTREIVPTRHLDDVLPTDHPNWALVNPPPPYTATDHLKYGRRVGASASKLERILQCDFNEHTSLN